MYRNIKIKAVIICLAVVLIIIMTKCAHGNTIDVKIDGVSVEVLQISSIRHQHNGQWYLPKGYTEDADIALLVIAMPDGRQQEVCFDLKSNMVIGTAEDEPIEPFTIWIKKPWADRQKVSYNDFQEIITNLDGIEVEHIIFANQSGEDILKLSGKQLCQSQKWTDEQGNPMKRNIEKIQWSPSGKILVIHCFSEPGLVVHLEQKTVYPLKCWEEIVFSKDEAKIVGYTDNENIFMFNCITGQVQEWETEVAYSGATISQTGRYVCGLAKQDAFLFLIHDLQTGDTLRYKPKHFLENQIADFNKKYFINDDKILLIPTWYTAPTIFSKYYYREFVLPGDLSMKKREGKRYKISGNEVSVFWANNYGKLFFVENGKIRIV